MGCATNSGGVSTAPIPEDEANASLTVAVSQPTSASISKSVSSSSTSESVSDSDNSGGGLTSKSDGYASDIPVVSVAKASSSSAVQSCNVYDISNGKQINLKAGKVSGNECVASLVTGRISSSSTKFLIEVILENGAKMPILEEAAVPSLLSGSKQVRSDTPADMNAVVALYQGLSGSGSDCLSAFSSRSIPDACLQGISAKNLYDTVSNLGSDSSTSGKSVSTISNMMTGFLLEGGSSGLTDPIQFLKKFNEGDASCINAGSNLARSGGETVDASTLQSRFTIMQKVGEVAASAFQDGTVRSQFTGDLDYQKKYLDFLKSVETPTQATQVASAGADGLITFFKDKDTFKSLNSTAAREAFVSEAGNNFANFDPSKISTFFKTIATTDYTGKTEAEIKNGVSFVTGYVNNSSAESLAALKQNPTILAQFVQSNTQAIDTTKLDSAYFSSFQTQLEQQSTGTGFTDTFSFTSFVAGSPAISVRTPAVSAALVSASTAVTVQFDRDMTSSSFTTSSVLLYCGGTTSSDLVTGTVAYTSSTKTLVFTPSANLTKDLTCTVSLLSDIKSFSGTPLTATTWTFTTERGDLSVTSRTPALSATNIPTNVSVTATFNRALDTLTVGSGLAVSCGGSNVAGTTALSALSGTANRVMTFTRNSGNFTASVTCTVTFPAGLKDIFGFTFTPPTAWTFDTGLGTWTTAPTFAGIGTLAADAGSATTITATWSAADSGLAGFLVYDIYCSTGAQNYDSATVTQGTGSSVPANTKQITGLTANTTYNCVVRARDSVGNRDSNVVSLSAKTGPLAPGAPSATVASATSIDLAWSSVTGASSYNVYRYTSTGVTTSDTLVTTVGTNSYTNTSLAAGDWYYKIAAVGSTGSVGPLSSEVNAGTLPYPTGFAATAGAAQNSLSWNTVTYATGYKIFWATHSGVGGSDSSITIDSGATTSSIHSSLTNGTTYYYKIVSFDAAGEQRGVGQATEISATLVMSEPKGLTTVGSTSGNVSFGWGSVSGASSYKYYYKDSSPVSTGNASASGGGIEGTSVTPGTDNGNNATSYYGVTAKDSSNNETAISRTIGIYIPNGGSGPTDLSISVDSTTSLSLSWTNANSRSCFRIYRSTSPDVATNGGDAYATTASTSYTDSGLTSGSAYYYRVKDADGSCSGDPGSCSGSDCWSNKEVGGIPE
ncbi:MAG: Ig-like domain-containing protein [Deltaproteobacteria bacterium]|nr:Ig-like domain-containing protein [Deltaproteobacteria bacterium]